MDGLGQPVRVSFSGGSAPVLRSYGVLRLVVRWRQHLTFFLKPLSHRMPVHISSPASRFVHVCVWRTLSLSRRDPMRPLHPVPYGVYCTPAVCEQQPRLHPVRMQHAWCPPALPPAASGKGLLHPPQQPSNACTQSQARSWMLERPRWWVVCSRCWGPIQRVCCL